MTSFLDLFKRSPEKKETPKAESGDSLMFSTAFVEHGVEAGVLVPWDARAVEVGARRIPAAQGGKLLRTLWAKDKFMGRLSNDATTRMERFYDYAVVPADRDVIRQGEYSNFMVVLLSGSMAVDRVQPWGEHVRLAEARPGDILGEMSLLDSGARFSHCITLTECELAVMNATALDDMMVNDPGLAASLVGLLARKLSLRMRVVSARVSNSDR